MRQSVVLDTPSIFRTSFVRTNFMGKGCGKRDAGNPLGASRSGASAVLQADPRLQWRPPRSTGLTRETNRRGRFLTAET
jgi:hypothetical protein